MPKTELKVNASKFNLALHALKHLMEHLKEQDLARAKQVKDIVDYFMESIIQEET